MTASYLIRMDDICPTMNWAVWDRIEAVFDNYSIKPILAVVPDNQDPQLMVDAANDEFWQRVRGWQRKGWTVGLHGYQHKYETSNSGIVGLNARSEFAGITKALQVERISNGIAIMMSEGVVPNVWVAPGHSFDDNTINALVKNGINVLSDGFFFRPVTYRGALWIPQQLWRFRALPFGLWTVCFHHNSFNERNLLAFEADIFKYRSQIVAFDNVLATHPASESGIVDKLAAFLWLKLIRAKRWINTRGK